MHEWIEVCVNDIPHYGVFKWVCKKCGSVCRADDPKEVTVECWRKDGK